MVARRTIVLAAAVGVALQGCDKMNKHVKSFIQLTCSANVDKLVSSVEDKWAEELRKQCQALKDAAEEKGIAFDQLEECLDEGATVLDEEKLAAAENYTKQCVAEMTEATIGKDFMAVREAVQKLISDWTPNENLGDSIKKHLNQTLGDIKKEANKHIDDAKDTLKDHVDSVSDDLHGGGDDDAAPAPEDDEAPAPAPAVDAGEAPPPAKEELEEDAEKEEEEERL